MGVIRGILASYPSETLRIEGHCDERGSDEYNVALGDKRAQAVLALGLITGDKRAIEAAEKALADPDPDVCSAAVTALADMDSKASLLKIKALIDHSNAKVIVAIAAALTKFKDPEGYELYYEVLTGKLPFVAGPHLNI